MSDVTARETPVPTEPQPPEAAPPQPAAVSEPTPTPEATGGLDRSPTDATKATPGDAQDAETVPLAIAASKGAAAKDPSANGSSPPPAATPAKRDVRLRLFGRTDVGQVREHNEDNFIVADLSKASRGLMESDRNQLVGERGALLGVCDGMGGAAAGEVASQLAVDIIYQKMLQGDVPETHDDLALRLVQAIEAAGVRIFSEAKLDRARRGMGTTSTIAALLDDHLFLGQVGDSRGYILRGDRLVQVTRDQSLVNQLIEAGQLTEEEAETFEHNNIILQALGTADTVQVDLTYVELKYGDTLLLCSDGLSGMVRNEEIREILRTVDDPLEACKLLTDRANQAGGHDNITVVVAKFEGDLDKPTPEEIESLKYRKYELPEPPASTPTATEASRRVKGLDEAKVSGRPGPRSQPPGRPSDPRIEVRDAGDDGEDDEARSLQAVSEDPIQIPTEGAPSWIVTMMIMGAVACVVVAGYYLLRP
jgi:protein phosphatase